MVSNFFDLYIPGLKILVLKIPYFWYSWSQNSLVSKFSDLKILGLKIPSSVNSWSQNSLISKFLIWIFCSQNSWSQMNGLKIHGITRHEPKVSHGNHHNLMWLKIGKFGYVIVVSNPSYKSYHQFNFENPDEILNFPAVSFLGHFSI